MKPNLFYCYNYKQSDFLIKQGISPIEMGRGNKGDIYLIFQRDDKFEEVFSRWCQRGKELKSTS